MPPKDLELVAKPLVGYSERLRNKRLQRYTIAQLRHKSQCYGLDSSRLTHKWEYIHVLILAKRFPDHVSKCSNTFSPNRKGFFDLPPEIRNMIYGLVYQTSLHSSNVYPTASSVGILQPPSYKDLSSLKKLGLVGHQMRREYWSFFFANSYMKLPTLDNLGTEMLRNIGDLACGHIGGIKANTTIASSVPELGLWLGRCSRLQHLSLALSIFDITKITPGDENNCAIDMSKDPRLDISTFLKGFAHLENLQVLSIRCATILCLSESATERVYAAMLKNLTKEFPNIKKIQLGNLRRCKLCPHGSAT